MDDIYQNYFLVGLAGFCAGLIRFYERAYRNKGTKWSFGAAFTLAFVGSLIGLVLIGWLFDELLVTNPVRCFSMALAAGYYQPNLSDMFFNFIQAIKTKKATE